MSDTHSYYYSLIMPLPRGLNLTTPTEGMDFFRALGSGIKIGLTAFAVWKDGRQVVGNLEHPLKEEMAQVDDACRTAFTNAFPGYTYDPMFANGPVLVENDALARQTHKQLNLRTPF